MNLFSKQKYGIITFILLINILLSSTFIIYDNHWYIFIIFLALSTFMNSVYAILMFSNIIYNKIKLLCGYQEYSYSINNTYDNKNIAIVVPCYNENKEELNLTFDSIFRQKNIDNNKKVLYIICDGKNNKTKTHEHLYDIFNLAHAEMYDFKFGYKTWDDDYEPITIYCGIKNNINFMIFIKKNNKGKRDSLTMIRRLLMYYNRRTSSDVFYHTNVIKYFNSRIINLFISKTNQYLLTNTQNILNIKTLIESEEKISVNSGSSDISDCVCYIDNMLNSIDDNTYDNKDTNTNLDYIYGTDADTELDDMCISELLTSIYKTDQNIVACVGFVDLFMKDSYFNPLKLYQYAEYYTAQLLRRNYQSTYIQKVNCLSGCNQIIKICEETCGDKILNLFNKKPKPDANIFRQILSSASEDRNHVTLMFQLFPYIRTIQCLKSKVYTKVPLNIFRFLSQRKRWNLGTYTNDILILLNSKHVFGERLQSFINILINSLAIFIFIATVLFIITIIKGADIIMVYLSIMIFIPVLYNLLTPFTKYNRSWIMTYYYYLSYLYYLVLGPVINIVIHLYTLWKLDDFNWNIL